MYILIGSIVAFFALSTAAAALPSSRRGCNDRPRSRRVPGEAGSAQNTVAKEAALALDGIYMPILR